MSINSVCHTVLYGTSAYGAHTHTHTYVSAVIIIMMELVQTVEWWHSMKCFGISYCNKRRRAGCLSHAYTLSCTCLHWRGAHIWLQTGRECVERKNWFALRRKAKQFVSGLAHLFIRCIWYLPRERWRLKRRERIYVIIHSIWWKSTASLNSGVPFKWCRLPSEHVNIIIRRHSHGE